MAVFLICGAGAMAEALVYDLAEFAAPDRIIVLDMDAARLAKFDGPQVETHCGDLSDSGFVAPFSRQADIACGAASYKLNLKLTELAIASRTHFIDLGGNNTVVQSQFALSDRASEAGVTVIPDCGLAPGMVSILVAAGVSHFEKAKSVKIRVGGLPQDPQPPLMHALSFSAEGLLNEYREMSQVLRNGKRQDQPSLTELERLSFPPNFPELEAFHTSGGVSTLPYTYEGRVDSLDYKTIRYPSHLEKIKLLFDLGLTDETPIEFDGFSVSPDKLLRRVLEQRLPRNVPDVIIVYVEVVGEGSKGSGQVSYYIEDYHNIATGHSAMQRMTAYSAGVIMQMIAERSITATGTIRLEQGVIPALFIQLLGERGIEIKVTTTS